MNLKLPFKFPYVSKRGHWPFFICCVPRHPLSSPYYVVHWIIIVPWLGSEIAVYHKLEVSWSSRLKVYILYTEPSIVNEKSIDFNFRSSSTDISVIWRTIYSFSRNEVLWWVIWICFFEDRELLVGSRILPILLLFFFIFKLFLLNFCEYHFSAVVKNYSSLSSFIYYSF